MIWKTQEVFGRPVGEQLSSLETKSYVEKEIIKLMYMMWLSSPLSDKIRVDSCYVCTLRGEDAKQLLGGLCSFGKEKIKQFQPEMLEVGPLPTETRESD